MNRTRKITATIVTLILLSATVGVIDVLAAVSSAGPFAPPIQPGGRGALAIISATPVIVAPPATVAMGANESDTQIKVFDEKQYFVLTAGLVVDHTTSVLGSSATIPSGTIVNSHYIHFDNVGSVGKRGVGQIVFDGNIVGVITKDSSLDASDFLGSPTTTYPVALLYRGLELGAGGELWQEYGNTWNNQDLLVISGNTLTVDLQVYNVLDQLRVITEPVFDGFVTGGGNIKNSKKSAWTFGGNVGVTQSGQIVGQFQINDHNGKETWHGHNAFTSLVLSGSPTWSPPASFDVATFEGTYTSNKGNTKYLKVEIWDDQEPGKDYDWITVWESTDAGINWTLWFVGNPISGGNFQLHDGLKD